MGKSVPMVEFGVSVVGYTKSWEALKNESTSRKRIPYATAVSFY
jgi:hypothetical protein